MSRRDPVLIFNNSEWSRGKFDFYNVIKFREPDEILARIGLAPKDIDTILITHHHFDHVSGIRYFPNADVYIQSTEILNWFEKFAAPQRISWLGGGLDPDTAADLGKVAVEGRLRLVDGVGVAAPGVQLRPAFNTHTAGSQYITVARSDGAPWVFTGDTCYLFENIGGLDGTQPYVPIGLAQGGQESILRSLDEMVRAAGDDVRRVIPSHEVKTWDVFPSVEFHDGLHLAEIALASGVKSKLATASA